MVKPFSNSSCTRPNIAFQISGPELTPFGISNSFRTFSVLMYLYWYFFAKSSSAVVLPEPGKPIPTISFAISKVYSSPMAKPRLIIFSSGIKDGSSSTTPLGFSKTKHRQENLGGGGSGFENLVAATKTGVLDADIVAVVSNHEHGGVRERADRLGVPFIHFDPPVHSNVLQNVGTLYREVVEKAGAEWVALSGWLRQVHGLDPAKTFNIHPALLSQLGGRFGGHGMYGKRLREAVADALAKGEITESGFTMHFVTDEMDRGPVFFEYRVPLKKGMSAGDIEQAVKAAEHEWQPKLTNAVIHGQISWDGKDPKSLAVWGGFRNLATKKN